jgi:hypothetical protein
MAALASCVVMQEDSTRKREVNHFFNQSAEISAGYYLITYAITYINGYHAIAYIGYSGLELLSSHRKWEVLTPKLIPRCGGPLFESYTFF